MTGGFSAVAGEVALQVLVEIEEWSGTFCKAADSPD